MELVFPARNHQIHFTDREDDKLRRSMLVGGHHTHLERERERERETLVNVEREGDKDAGQDG